MLSVVRGAALTVCLFFIGCSNGTHREAMSSPEARTPPAAAARGMATEGNAVAAFGKSEPAPHPMLIGAPISPVPIREITLDEFRQHVRERTAVILDARGARDFQREHVRGAMNLVPSQLNTSLDWIHQNIAPDQLTIIYCAGLHCESSEMVYEFLESQGYTNLRVFKPGWEALADHQDLQ